MDDDFHIGRWRVHPRRNIVLGPAGERHVKPRAMAVLVHLADAGGEVVERKALMDAVWGSAVVSEDVLTQAIVELRRAFGDDARHPKVIETIHRVGFRLLAEVRVAKRAGGGAPGRRAAAVAAIAAIAGLVYWLAGPSAVEDPADRSAPSVAVLPFENLSPDPDNAYFAVGIHEEILNQLAKLSSMSVIARTSVLPYADRRSSIQQIADELDVEAVMEGSIRYADDRVRITAQLIRSDTGTHLWSETYERGFDDIFAIESDIAMDIANALDAEFSTAEQENIESVPTAFPAAYALYLRSLREPGDDAVALLDRAIALDPDFALAHASKAYKSAFGTVDAAQQEKIIRASAERALELDPTLGLAYAALGYLHRSNWNWAEARKAFQRAVELNPNEPRVLSAAGRVSRRMGDYAQGARLGRRAVKLDPNNDNFHYQLGITLRYARNYEAAYTALRNAADLDPSEAANRMQLAFTEIMRGNREAAVSELQIAEHLLGSTERSAFRVVQLALAHAQLGRHQDVDRLLAQLEGMEREPVDDAVWAMAYIARGMYERALSRLDTAIAKRSPGSILALDEIKANPYQDPVLEEDRRFVAARARIGAADFGKGGQ